MSIKTNTEIVQKIDYENRVIRFDAPSSGLKKITGSKLASILGENAYDTPFELACSITGIYSKHESSKFTDAGNALEPVMRSYVRTNAEELVREALGVAEGSIVGVLDPVPNSLCGYDHFPDAGIFGGMVDGYVVVNGEKVAVLEIKTASNESKWIDKLTGTRTEVPRNYLLQAALYAKLSGLKKIVFVAGFLRDNHYEDTNTWVPNKENCQVIVIDAPDISDEMEIAEDWYNRYPAGGVTPEWTEKDSEIVETLQLQIQGPPGKDLAEITEEYANVLYRLSEYEDVTSEINALEKRKKELSESIKESIIGSQNDGRPKMIVESDGYSFVVSRTSRTDIDKDKLKEDGLLEKYQKENVSYALRVKQIKGN
jgi:predicted phage-related endonuclease